MPEHFWQRGISGALPAVFVLTILRATNSPSPLPTALATFAACSAGGAVGLALVYLVLRARAAIPPRSRRPG